MGHRRDFGADGKYLTLLLMEEKMVRHTSFAASRRWGWIVILLGGLAWVSIGCNPQSLSMIMMPWTDNKAAPEYKLFSDKKTIKLVILANFRLEGRSMPQEIVPAEHELAESVSQFFNKRCLENKQKIEIVSHMKVRDFQVKDPDANPIEIGKHFKADYVLELDINSLSVYAKIQPKMFKGSAEIEANLYKMDAKEGEYKVFTKNIASEYPVSRPPVEANGASPVPFRRAFITELGREISRLFIPFDPEEKKMMK
jgi:hypothetical protein